MARDEEDPRDPNDPDDDPDEWFASALVLTPRQPFIDWALSQVLRSETTEADARETMVVLTPELPTEAARDAWLAQHHPVVFARSLAPWTEDESRWPADRSLATLRTWFDVVWSPSVDDMSGAEVLPAVACGPVSLPALVAEYKSLAAGSGFFLDVQNGDMVSFSPEELDALDHADAASAGLEEKEFADLVQLFESATLVELPSPSDDTELALMEAFAETIRVPATRNRLKSALDSKKPARRFQETVDTSGLRKQWLAWRDGMITEALRGTLGHFKVPFNEPGDGEA